jgi:hypothetical protein
MNRIQRLLPGALVATAACLAIAGVAASVAQADFGISDFEVSTEFDGLPAARQAGAHPNLRTIFFFNQTEAKITDGNVRDVSVDLPPGLTGNPLAAPTCPLSKLTGDEDPGAVECPSRTLIGTATAFFPAGIVSGVYNLKPPSSSPGMFGMNFLGVPIIIEPTVRPGDYAISSLSARTSQGRMIYGVDVELWGVPKDHNGSDAPRLPFLTNPTSCTGMPSPFTVVANSWQDENDVSSKVVSADAEGTPFIYSGCEKLPFEPTIVAQPGTHRAASPTGLDINIEVPQNNGPDGLATAHVRKIVTRFPQGVTVSTSAVAGLGACSEAEIGIGNNNAPACPDSSKLGNVSIRTPLLEKPVEGDVYLAKQKENPFHSTFAIYMVARGPGFYLKLPAELNVDKQTGQLSTVFENLPQLPFEEAHLDFRGGPTAPLTTPDICGTYTTHTEFTSWASADPVIQEAPMVINENCSGGGAFNPTLQAGVASPVAGANSPLTFRIRRQDGEQNLSRLEFTLPEGELAKLKGVEVCPESLAPSGACGVKSQVGVSTTAIGTGAFPLFVPQPGKDPTALYLAGPYKGAPYSLITKVPAQSGPFDFGMIVVRTAINLNPITSQVIAKSDPLPQILEGVPIQYRDVRIEVQKPDFTVNPTSCEQRYLSTTITSTEGAVAHPQTPFKVGDCASLNFGPKLAFKLKGGTHRGDFQALTATLTTGTHEANISRVAVTLPHSEFLEQGHIGTVCTRVQFAAKNCPAASIYGFAEAVTPLLDKPLSGPVYLRSSNHRLPDLVAALNGQFDIELASRIDSKHGGIRNTFEVVPDAPVTTFVLKMKGGAKSLLVNSRNLCNSVARAEVKLVGQNGMRHNERPVVKNGCSAKAKRKAAHAGHRKH